MHNIALRHASSQDRFLIRRWLADQQLHHRHRIAASTEAEITLVLTSAASLPRIIERDGEPVGYAYAVETASWAEQSPDGVPAGAWTVDYLVAPAATGIGEIAGVALALLAEEVFTTTLAVACAAVVPVTNETAARAYEHAGFRWQRIWPDRLLGPSWLMLKERPAAQQSR